MLDYCAGPSEGSLDEQWEQLGRAADLLAEAPEDEVLAEILMLQVIFFCMQACTQSCKHTIHAKHLAHAAR